MVTSDGALMAGQLAVSPLQPALRALPTPTGSGWLPQKQILVSRQGQLDWAEGC